MTALAWAATGLAVWLIAAAVIGPWIGRVIRRRDRQIPRGES